MNTQAINLILKLSLILLFLVFYSCNSKREKKMIKTNFSHQESVSLKFIEDITIDISKEGFTMYDTKALIPVDSGLIFIGYKRFANVLDIFNISSKKLLNRILFDQDGPNSIQNIHKIYSSNLDSIFIKEDLSIKLINLKGEIINSVSTMVSGIPNIPEGKFISYNDANIHFNNSNKKFTGFYFPNSNYDLRKLDYDCPLICTLDFNNMSVEILDIFYPEIVRKNYSLIPDKMPNIQFFEDKIIYGFPFYCNFYVFDYKTNIVKEFGGESKYSNNFELDDKSEVYQYRLTGTIFYNFEYVTDKDIYLRAHWGSQDRLQLDGSISSSDTKKAYIIFFDNDFNKINEIEIDSDYWIEEHFIHDNFLYLYKKDTRFENENNLVFGKFEIQ